MTDRPAVYDNEVPVPAKLVGGQKYVRFEEDHYNNKNGAKNDDEFDWGELMFWNNDRQKEEILAILRASEAKYMSRLTQVEETVRSLKRQNDELKEDVVELKEDRAYLQEDVRRLRQDNAKLRENILGAIRLNEETKEEETDEEDPLANLGNIFGSVTASIADAVGIEEEQQDNEEAVSMQFVREEMAADILHGVVYRFILRRRMKKERKAATTIQSAARGYFVRQPHRMKAYRKAARQRQKRLKAILVIQPLARRWIIRNRQEKQKIREEEAARTIQRAARRYLERRRGVPPILNWFMGVQGGWQDLLNGVP